MSRWLHAVFCQRTPADREDVSGVEGAPIVKGASPAVKHDKDLLTSDLSNCGGTNQVRVFSVHRFQLHTRLEVVFHWAGWFLNTYTQISTQMNTVQSQNHWL